MTQAAPSVSVIIPAHNEADRIADTIRALRSLPNIAQIIVVDDASHDSTDQAAQQAGADMVVRRDACCGKGAALTTGLARAKASIIAFVDADLGDSAQEMARVVEPVVAGDCDMAIASPGPAAKGGFGTVVKMARRGIKKLCGVEMQSPLSGQRAMRRELLDRIGELEHGYGVDVALTIDALRAGARVKEVPVDVTHRELGKSLRGFLHRAGQWRDVRSALRKRSESAQ